MLCPVAETDPFFIKDTTQLIQKLLQSNPCFEKFLNDPDKYEIQIIYTRIDRDQSNKPHFRQFSYRVNDKEYFNPASFVKLPTILVALEKMKSLKAKGIDLSTIVKYDNGHECQTELITDTSSASGNPCIGHFIKKALLASDDDAYNRLYEFTGQQILNERLWQMGFSKTCILQRFQNCCYDCNRYTNPITFYNDDHAVIYNQPMQINPNKYDNPLGKVLKGKEYMLNNGKMVYQPRDYSLSNNLPLQDLHDMLIATIFPESVSVDKRFDISHEDYPFLLKYLSLFPSESDIRMYKNEKTFPFDYKKYMLWEQKPWLRCFNVNAYTYGYMGDCAYIADFKNKIEFILLAVIYTNETESIQPKNYQYTTLGIPFLKYLGKTIYDVEMNRKKTFLPDLSGLEKLIN
jgi:hypothetical protein